MAHQLFRPAPARKADAGDKAKIAKLKEMRLANDAARREAGTWGELCVRELTHEPSGEVYVFCCRGRAEPDVARLNRTRSPEVSVAEHKQLQEWLGRSPTPILTQALLGWDLSRTEAERVKQARIAEHKAGGRRVVNEEPAEL